MLDSIKEALAENWKGAVVGAVVAAAILLGLPSNLVLKVNNMFTDEDPLAELCADYEAPAEEAPAEEAPAADAGVEAPAADAGSADAGGAADAAVKAD